MPRFTVMYFDGNEQEHEVIVRADDAAAALGLVIDEHDDIAPGSPFAICEAVGRKKKAAAAKRAEDEHDERLLATARTRLADELSEQLGAIPMAPSPKAEEDAHEQLARILGGSGCKMVS